MKKANNEYKIHNAFMDKNSNALVILSDLLFFHLRQIISKPTVNKTKQKFDHQEVFS